jgi:hypothetical protein
LYTCFYFFHTFISFYLSFTCYKVTSERGYFIWERGVYLYVFLKFSCINTVFFSLIEIFLLQYCFRHCAFCNLDWGITIYHHFKILFRMYAYVSFIVDVKKHNLMWSEKQWISMFGKWSIDQGGCSTKWNNCIPQDIDTSCRYANDPRWFPQVMDVTESHHIVLNKCSHLNRTTSTFVLKFSPLQVANSIFVQYINKNWSDAYTPSVFRIYADIQGWRPNENMCNKLNS